MNDNAKAGLLYGGVVALSLASLFTIAGSGIMGGSRTHITVDPQAREITQRQSRSLTVPFYSDVQTVTTVFNLDSGTKAVTDFHVTTAGLIVTDNGKPAQTSPITAAELTELGQKSREAAHLIATLNPG